MHVLILGARAPAALEWARAFATTGAEVTVADSVVAPLSRFSHSVRDFVQLPEPRSNPGAWIESLRLLVVDKNVDLIVPTCEEVFYLAWGKERLPCQVATMSLEELAKLHHKFHFAERTRDWPIAAPESHLLETRADVHPFLETARHWVFKPAYSRFASRTLIRPSRADLLLVSPSKEQPWIAQRFVAGIEHCSYSVLVEGHVTAHACYQPRYRVGHGSGIWFEPRRPQAVLRFVQHFGTATGYSGQVAFDFIEDHEGTFSVLECNPRATSGIHLFDDQPHALVAALRGVGTGVVEPTTTPRQVGLAMLLFSMRTHALQRQWWKDLFSARDVIARRGDWAPLPAQIPGVLETAWRALSRRRGLLAAATADIEWDGQRME